MRIGAIALAVLTAAASGCGTSGAEPEAAPADPGAAPVGAGAGSSGAEPGSASAVVRPTEPPPPEARETRAVSEQSLSVTSGSAHVASSEQVVTVATDGGRISARSVGDGIEVDLVDAPGWRSSRHDDGDGTITVTWTRSDGREDDRGDDDRIEVVLALRDGSIVTRTSSVTTSGGASR